MEAYRLGLVSVSFRQYAPEQILASAGEAGLRWIEWGSDIHAPYQDRETLEKLARLQREYGIGCCSYGTYFRLGMTPLDELDGYITAAGLLGTDTLRLWCGTKNAEEYTDEEKEALFAECRAAEQIAKRRGVKLCMECHRGTLTHTKEAALELMAAVNSDHFRMYWQPNQHRTEEENIAYARLIAPYTERIHVFHWEGKLKLPLAPATDVWKRYLAQFPPYQTLLLEFMPDGKIESLKTEAAALRKIAEEDR